MNIFRFAVNIIFCIVTLVLVSCSEERAKTKDGKISVFVSIPPQKYIVNEIAGNKVEVSVLVPPGREPHDYEVLPRQMATLWRADAYFKIGLPFEKILLEKIKKQNVKLKIFNMAEGIKKVPLEEHLFDHADPGHTQEGEPDPHIWLSPPLLKKMAENTCAGLCEIAPADALRFKSNLARLEKKIANTGKEIKTAMAPFKGSVFIVFHPAFGYFAEFCGLKQYPVQIEGKSPSPKQIRKLIETARKMKVRIIFVQPQFDKKSAEAIAKAINGAVVPLDPLAENVLENLKTISRKIKKSFK